MTRSWWAGAGIAHAPDGAAAGGALSWGDRAQREAVRECVAAYVRAHGRKRGLAMAAQAIGMGERAARHAHEGGDFAADADRASRADAARFQLLTEQLRQIQAEAALLQSRRLDVAMGGAALDARRRVLHVASSGSLPARKALTP